MKERCAICARVCGNAGGLAMHMRSAHEGRHPQGFKDRCHTEETKLRERETHLGSVPWNKNLTKESDIRVATSAVKNSKTQKGRTPWNKNLLTLGETKRKISRSLLALGRVSRFKGEGQDCGSSY